MIKYLTAFFIFINTLFAHPHTFIDVFPTVASQKDKIKNIRIQWRYDEMTSELLIMESDINGNGKIDKSELPYIKRNYFDPSEEFNYYSDIRVSDKKIKTKPLNFNAKIINNKFIAFEFDLKINANKKDVKLAFYDTEMFTAFMLKKDFVKSNIGFRIVDVDNDYYFAYRLQFN